MQQLLSNPPFLLPFLPSPVSSIPIYPLRSNERLALCTDQPPYILGCSFLAIQLSSGALQIQIFHQAEEAEEED